MPIVLAVDGLAELAIISVAIALILMRRVWVSTFGKLLLTLAGPFDKVNWRFSVLGHGFSFGFGWVATLLRHTNSAALALFGAGITATDYAAKRLWHWTAYLVEQTGRVIGDLAESTYSELRYLRHISMPGFVHAALHPIASKVEWLIHRMQHLEVNPTTIIHRVTRVLDPRVKTLEHDVARLEHAVALAGAAVLTPPIPVRLPGLAGIRTGLDAIRARVGRLAHELSPAVLAGLVATALVTLRLGWLKCGGVRRVARHACGMDRDALDVLLEATTLIVGTVSLVEFARGMQGLTDEIAAGTTAFWRS